MSCFTMHNAGTNCLLVREKIAKFDKYIISITYLPSDGDYMEIEIYYTHPNPNNLVSACWEILHKINHVLFYNA